MVRGVNYKLLSQIKKKKKSLGIKQVLGSLKFPTLKLVKNLNQTEPDYSVYRVQFPFL